MPLSRSLSCLFATCALVGCASSTPAALSAAGSSTPSAPSASSAAEPGPSALPASSSNSQSQSNTHGETTITFSQSGLMKVDALSSLPKGHAVVGGKGLPASRFHYGVFRNPDALKAFTDRAGLKTMREVDWIHEVVVFVALDAQTNSLSVPVLVSAAPQPWLMVQWSGIEPHYEDSTPISLAIVRPGKIDTLEVAIVNGEGGERSVLGTLSVSTE